MVATADLSSLQGLAAVSYVRQRYYHVTLRMRDKTITLMNVEQTLSTNAAKLNGASAQYCSAFE